MRWMLILACTFIAVKTQAQIFSEPMPAWVPAYDKLYQPLTKTLKLPLYYTGLTHTVRVREKEGISKTYNLNRNYEIDLTFTLRPESYSWFVIE